jgi:hypothetical protein
MSANRRLLLAGLLCFASFLLFYGLTSRGNLQTSDETAVFATGISLATRGNLAIDELQWLDSRVNVGQKGRDGHFYTKYFPGNVFSIALAYKLTARANDQPYVGPYGGVMEFAPSVTGARWAMKVNALWGALGMTALLFLLRRYFDWRTAILAVVLVGLCSDWWYQSRGLFSEVGAGAFLIASLCFAVYGKPYGSGATLALSMLFRPTNLLGLPIFGWAVWRKGKILHAVGSGVILAAGGLILAAYNWARFGSVLNPGYGSGILSVPFFQGLHAMFLSPGRSFFVYSPILLLAIPGAWLFYKRDKVVTIICLAIAAGYVVIIAPLAPLGWGLTWGARLLIPIVPLLTIFAASVLERVWNRKWIACSVLLLAALGLSVQVVALLQSPTKVMIDEVASGKIQYEDTIYSVRNCWLALQIRSLSQWQSCELDSYTLRRLFTKCPN